MPLNQGLPSNYTNLGDSLQIVISHRMNSSRPLRRNISITRLSNVDTDSLSTVIAALVFLYL
jgi:hypothetical protein